ncbi:MAG: DNA polymerase domain-containing protein [Candidatus Binatus sp.]|uniref:DNA polymerase domain-containing protein n=1 Tax=Candidatus Binatus sp. TaxID=2811406 RepID=UPI00271FDB08|nr:DNA polymerase domain-containing protein [Candidatus Binatus sp.]MDO8433423.1 DNA polymerase domain-containing protein [Candidatus Binatus sp.]
MTTYQEISAQFYSNRLLFGDPADSGVVAAEIDSKNAIDIYRRLGGKLIRERRPLKLFLLVENPALMNGLRPPHQMRALDGDFRYRTLVTFDSLDALEAAKRHLRSVTNQAANAPDAPYLVLADPIEQHLMLTGTTFFIGMDFSELHRLQVDIETYISPGFEFPSAAREGDRIIAISITDSLGFERLLKGTELDERAMLEEMVRIFRERDPDVVEGHNLFRFDLEYLETRARRHRVRLALGREGKELRARASRLQIAERSIAYRRYEIPGRNIIDTWILAQHYDISSRKLESLGLKQLALHFGLARKDRVYIDASKISEYFEHEPDKLYEYALDDARETRALAEVLSPSYFVQAQIFPYSYQNAVLRGNATKIDALMMRAYLDAGHSIPSPSAPAPVLGGYTEMKRCGVARGVLHCDVTSLYPSLMLLYRHAPAADRLVVFLKLLGDLRSFRVQAKALARTLSGGEQRNADALQQTFKILINSFYGYLGFSLGHFNDFEQANAVTRRGRELIQLAVAKLEEQGAQVIEVDTDGIYFVPPADAAGDDGADALLERVAAIMPEGIKLEIDGRYAAMFSYKMKNYVLQDASGEMTVRGSGLRSRGLERFQRRFMEETFHYLLEDRRGEIVKLHDDYRERLARREIGIADLMKTETLRDSLEVYRGKIGGKQRNLSAAYELAMKAERPYLAGDQISYYVSGRGPRVPVNIAAKMATEYDPAQPDENIEYYQLKLADLLEKFRPFIARPGLFVPDPEPVPPQQLGLFDRREAEPKTPDVEQSEEPADELPDDADALVEEPDADPIQ